MAASRQQRAPSIGAVCGGGGGRDGDGRRDREGWRVPVCGGASSSEKGGADWSGCIGGAAEEGRDCSSTGVESIASSSDCCHGRQLWLVHHTVLPLARRSCRSPVPPRTRGVAFGVPSGTSTSSATQYRSHVPSPGFWPQPRATSMPVTASATFHTTPPVTTCTCMGSLPRPLNSHLSPAPVASTSGSSSGCKLP